MLAHMSTATMDTATKTIWEALGQIPDPELGIDLVSMGLIYSVNVSEVAQGRIAAQIVMTLTTPGCPLAGSFDSMIRSGLSHFDKLDVDQDLTIELTFDPPWVPDMMTEEARAELALVI